MNIDDIEYLIAVAEHGSIGRAAESLGLTQPALTRAVARLETLAGQRLFMRHPKGVVPTPAGRALLSRALRIRAEYDDAMRELQQMKSGQQGLLRLGYSPSVDKDLVIDAARRLLLERPAARLSLVEQLMQPLLERLVDGRLDLAVAPVPTPMQPELAATVLYRDRLRLAADRNHPLLRQARIRWEDVAAQPWFLPSAQVRIRRLLDRRVAEAGLPPLNARVECDVVSVDQFRMLRGTRLLAICSEWSEPAMRRFGIEFVPIEQLGLDREVASIRRAGGYVSPLSERLDELLRAGLRRRPAHADRAATNAPP